MTKPIFLIISVSILYASSASLYAEILPPGHPGISRIEFSDRQSKDILKSAGCSIWWISNHYALISSESLPNATPLFEPSPSNILLMIRSTKVVTPSESLFQQSSQLDSSTWLVSIDPTNPLIQEIQGVRLPEPVSYRSASRFVPRNPVTAKPAVQTLVSEVSADDLIADVAHLVDYRSRKSTALGCILAGEWIETTLRDLDYSILTQRHHSDMAPSIIAERTGSTIPDEIVVICAHYDSTNSNPRISACPGADDNGTGTAAILHTARILSGLSFERTLRIIAFSGEEQGLYGSAAYAKRAADLDEHIIAVYNYDMVGWVSPAPEDLDLIGNPESMSLIEFFQECATVYTSLDTVAINDESLVYSDHSPFWLHGYSACLGIEDEPLNYPYYHSAEDTTDKVNPEFFAQTTQALLAATVETTGLIESPQPTPTSPPEESAVNVTVLINQSVFQSDDTFILAIDYRNDLPNTLETHFYLVLDIEGSFWFWPTWEQIPGGESLTLFSHTRRLNEQLLKFKWPDVQGSMSNLRFWAAFLDESESRLIGQYDMKSFGFE